uniref:ATP synthase F0 subunit 8 n=1 Tax=Eurydice pulchra TaxID=155694 RepID=E3SX86_EURPU|nr:ATP synthase F0 subunit 8 [Eurydice pulchra]
MPQMAPMPWLSLQALFVGALFITMAFLYFSKGFFASCTAKSGLGSVSWPW